jgi:4'-phosphopantetheinyl transferase
MNAVIYVTEIPEIYKKKNMEHMIGEKILEMALKKEYGRDLRFEPRAKGEHGKPFFTLQPGIYYNISHSGDYVACALANQQVGLDIQQHKEAPYQKILRRMVPEAEMDAILSAPDLKQVFFDQWVLREAYIKWTGEGLARDLRTIWMDEGWHELLDFQEGYSAAIWMADPHQVRWEQVEVELPR